MLVHVHCACACGWACAGLPHARCPPAAAGLAAHGQAGRQPGGTAEVAWRRAGLGMAACQCAQPSHPPLQAQHALAGELPREIYAEQALGEGSSVPPVRTFSAVGGGGAAVGGGRYGGRPRFALPSPAPKQWPGSLVDASPSGPWAPQVLLVAHPFANSLPSALEALARLQQVGAGSLLHCTCNAAAVSSVARRGSQLP